jgi:hypothetical protein
MVDGAKTLRINEQVIWAEADIGGTDTMFSA